MQSYANLEMYMFLHQMKQEPNLLYIQALLLILCFSIAYHISFSFRFYDGPTKTRMTIDDDD